MEKNDYLKLENQLCFPLYASSRLITRMYQPLLEELKITYPQYLIMLVLWEKDEQKVRDIGEKLLLETNTLTPLLKRMETKGILKRRRSEEDERKVIIKLTAYGNKMKEKGCFIPENLLKNVSDKYSIEKVVRLREDLKELIKSLES